MVVGTNHTSFTVSDVNRSVAFFREVIGLELVSMEPRDPAVIAAMTGIEGAEVMVAYLRGQGHTMEMVEYLAPEDREHVRLRPCDVGFVYVAYDVSDLDSVIEAARDHDVKPISPPLTLDKGPNRGSRVAYLRDPDGITLEFVERRT